MDDHCTATKPVLELYCDGSGAERMNRPGAWAWAAVSGETLRAERVGFVDSTTCLLMELEAARDALVEVVAQGLHEVHQVVLVSDCRIALEVAAGTFTPKPPRYASLVAALRAAALEARASTRWIRAHAGHRWNEHVDALARAARTSGHQLPGRRGRRVAQSA